jgi:hypothetical protein
LQPVIDDFYAASARNSPRQNDTSVGQFQSRQQVVVHRIAAKIVQHRIYLFFADCRVERCNGATALAPSQKVDIRVIGNEAVRCITNVTSLARFGKNAGSSRAHDCYLCPQILSFPALAQIRNGMSMIARG